jgi:hypothetical protein
MPSTEKQLSALVIAYVELAKKLGKDCGLNYRQLATALSDRANGDCKNDQETATCLRELAKELNK